MAQIPDTPAFPRDLDGEQRGMTLRDYFAAAAMGGLLACPVQPQSGVDMFARDAYKIADAMMAKRSKEQT